MVSTQLLLSLQQRSCNYEGLLKFIKIVQYIPVGTRKPEIRKLQIHFTVLLMMIKIKNVFNNLFVASISHIFINVPFINL